MGGDKKEIGWGLWIALGCKKRARMYQVREGLLCGMKGNGWVSLKMERLRFRSDELRTMDKFKSMIFNFRLYVYLKHLTCSMGTQNLKMTIKLHQNL